MILENKFVNVSNENKYPLKKDGRNSQVLINVYILRSTTIVYKIRPLFNMRVLSITCRTSPLTIWMWRMLLTYLKSFYILTILTFLAQT